MLAFCAHVGMPLARHVAVWEMLIFSALSWGAEKYLVRVRTAMAGHGQVFHSSGDYADSDYFHKKMPRFAGELLNLKIFLAAQTRKSTGAKTRLQGKVRTP